MATMPVQYKSSLQTFEGKMVLIFNSAGFIGTVALIVVQMATKDHLFAQYADQLTAIGGFLLAYNGYFAKLRTNYKTALAALDVPVVSNASGL
jgi:hypothetical protein